MMNNFAGSAIADFPEPAYRSDEERAASERFLSACDRWASATRWALDDDGNESPSGLLAGVSAEEYERLKAEKFDAFEKLEAVCAALNAPAWRKWDDFDWEIELKFFRLEAAIERLESEGVFDGLSEDQYDGNHAPLLPEPWSDQDSESASTCGPLSPSRNGSPAPANGSRGDSSAKPTGRRKPGRSADPAVEAAEFRDHRIRQSNRIPVFWRGSFWVYEGAQYRELQTTEMRADLIGWLNGRLKMLSSSTVSSILDQLRAVSMLASNVEPPAWIGGDFSRWPAAEVLPCRNQIVHLPSFVAGNEFSAPNTPRLFSTSALDFDFDPLAPRPARWLAFLNELWPDDPASIDALQCWFGYSLLPDTSQHKILLIVGPKRGGKGTIAKTLQSLVGKLNVAAPTLGSLGTNFGRWPLLGKTLAIIADARISRRSDVATIAEQLLSISGEDAVTIDRKMLEPITTKLHVRFVILTNELPQLVDSSGALVSRFVILRLTKSWLGREDTKLFDKLKGEMPGILLWAIAGWKRLRDRGHFVEPQSAADLRKHAAELASPVEAFIAEHCEVAPGLWTSCADLYSVYERWCERIGNRKPDDLTVFGRNLRAAVPSLERKQRRQGGKLVWGYLGIGLKPQDQQEGREP